MFFLKLLMLGHYNCNSTASFMDLDWYGRFSYSLVPILTFDPVDPSITFSL